MKKNIALFVLALLGQLALAQQGPATGAGSSDVERARIDSERARLEAGFAAENAACHEKFWVNNCLDEVNTRRRERMADLRRQEIALNDRDRKLKGADQIRKTEEKSSPEKQQEAANRRAEALKDFQSRMEREKQKNTDQAGAQTAEEASKEAAAGRAKNSQDKAATRAGKQAAASEEARKYNERQQQAQERKARRELERRSNTKAPAKTLPTPE